MKHILVTGCNGQLGNEIRLLSAKYNDEDWQFYFTDINELDITDRKAIYTFVEQNHISIIINPKKNCSTIVIRKGTNCFQKSIRNRFLEF